MQQTIQRYHKQIKDLKTFEEFTTEIQQRKKDYDDLFTEDIIAHLIIDELQRNPQSTIAIKDVHAGMECTVKGIITEINEPQTFTKKNNHIGRLKKCILTDETGSIPLILWNDDTEILTSGHLQKQSTVTIINGYSKKGYHGIELNVGRWSKIEISEPPEKKPISNHSKQSSTISGIIKQIKPTTIFFKEDGTEGFIAKLKIQTKNIQYPVICWDKHVKTIQQFSTGDHITITDASYRYLNGQQEIHVNGDATITKS